MMKRVRCAVVAILCGLCASHPAIAQALPAVGQGQQRTITVDNLTAARLILEMGDRQTALKVLTALVTDDPLNADAWFLLGIARRSVGDQIGAADAFQEVTRLQPLMPRSYLELGQTLTGLKRYDAAKAAFDQGLRLADDRVVRRNIRKYMQIIEENRDLNFSFSARMQPDTNPAASSGQKVVNIGGIPYVLNTPTSAKNAMGVGVVTNLRYAPWLDDTTRLAVDVGYNGVRFAGACCNDENINLGAGAVLHVDHWQLAPQAYHRQRFFNNKPYSDEDGMHFDGKYAAEAYRWTAGGEVGSSRLVQIAATGMATRGFVGSDMLVTGTWTAGVVLRLERDSYMIPSQSFTAPAIEAHTGFLGPFELPINLWAATLYRGYDGATLTSSGKRADHYWTAGVSVELDFINAWGMSPSLGVAYEREASNDPLGRFNRVKLLFGLGRVF